MKEDIEEYFEREVLPHVKDSWIDFDKTKVGYEINFTRYFYEYKPLRATSEIRKDIEELRATMQGITEKAVN